MFYCAAFLWPASRQNRGFNIPKCLLEKVVSVEIYGVREPRVVWLRYNTGIVAGVFIRASRIMVVGCEDFMKLSIPSIVSGRNAV